MSGKVKEAETVVKITDLSYAHTWIHDGSEVLLLKCVGIDGSSFGGYKWPLTVGAAVKADKWTGAADCNRGGLFGWPWGFGLGDGKDPDWSGKWIVFGAVPENIVGNVDNGRKCKAKSGTVRFVGDWNSAMQFILNGQMALVAHIASQSKETHATGNSSASSATGYSSASSATGDSSASIATGDSSASIVTGIQGRVRAGKYGCLALAWWNDKEGRGEMRCREIGCGDGSDGKLKADTWYRLNETAEFEEIPQ